MQNRRGCGAAHRNGVGNSCEIREANRKNRSRPAAFRMARVERLRCEELILSVGAPAADYMSPPGIGMGVVVVVPGTAVDGATIIVGLPPAQSHDSPPVAYPPP
jgi:hypothetical protein